MKSLFKNICAAIALVIILFSGCKNPAEDVKIIVDSDIFKAPVLVNFVNAKPGGASPSNFTVNIIGPDADLVRTTTGGKVFKSAQGLLNLVLDRTANPTVQNPVRYTLVIEAAGFAPTFKDVELVSATIPVVIEVKLTEYANPSEGTGVLVTTNTIANGTSSGELAFITGTNATMAEKSRLNVEPGTAFMDAAGQVISGNQVDTRMVYLGKKNNGAGNAAIPGGPVVQKIVNKNGQTIDGGAYFDPMVAVTIDMAIGGKAVKKFSKPLGLDIELKPQTVNEKTGALIKENDILSVWSLDNSTGVWKADGNATVVKNAEGKLVARTQINHLSSFALLFEEFYIVPTPPYIFLYSLPEFKIQIGPILDFLCLQEMTIERDDAAIDEIFEISGGKSNSFVTLEEGVKSKTFFYNNGRISSNAAIPTITVRGPEKYLPLTVSDGSCDNIPIFKMATKPDVINIAIDLKFQCAGKNMQTGINCYAVVKPVGADGKEGPATFIQLIDGAASAVAVNGATYRISTEIDGVAYASTFTANKANLPLSGGSGLSGSVIYNPAGNMLNIVGVVSKNCK